MRTIAVMAATVVFPLAWAGCASNPGPESALAAASMPVYDVDSVDVRPVLLSRIQPRFPNRLREAYIGGTVWLQFVVDARGGVEESSIRVLCSTDREFETPAIVARRRFRYNPGRVSEAPVRTQTRDNVRFVVTRRGVRQALPICEPNPESPRFFAANRWVDRDQDGRVARDEFEGVKLDFRSDERVTFVGLFDHEVGSQIQSVVKAPDGTTTDTRHVTQSIRNEFLTLEYVVQDLIAQHGPGQWVVEWYANGRYVGASRANLMR